MKLKFVNNPLLPALKLKLTLKKYARQQAAEAEKLERQNKAEAEVV